MADFEAVGRQHIIDQVEQLETAEPGWNPTFYMTLTYEGDIEAARLLRDQYDMPRPADRQMEINCRRKAWERYVADCDAKRAEHKRRMETEFWYRVKHWLQPKYK